MYDSTTDKPRLSTPSVKKHEQTCAGFVKNGGGYRTLTNNLLQPAHVTVVNFGVVK